MSAVAPRARRLARAFLALVALTTGLIVLGALVRAHDAGLACPDWPLCFGEWIPRMDLQVAFEWTHRLVAGTLSLCFVGLALLTWREPALRRRAGIAIAVTAALFALQILLGALTVWQLLAAWTVTSHLLVGNSINALLLWTALALREAAGSARERGRAAPEMRAACAAVALVLATQMALGGLVASSYAGGVCPKWPTCRDGVWFPAFRGAVGLHLLHRLDAYALVALLAALAWATRRHAALRGPARALLALALLQAAVGVANVRLGLPVEVTGLHSGLAAVLVLCLTVLLRRAFVGAAPLGTDRAA